ncbi:MAG: type II secretion system protein [Lachnospiraceae bacterium]|nr:type II secretion system protein [Lachnospiraceae bacterium]
MKKIGKKYEKRGFTLVELIVVLVILAVLAAILIPALLGYIDRAKEKKDILNAKNCMTATQAKLTKMYANRSASDTSAINGTKTPGDHGDMWLKGSDFSKTVFETADDLPYMYIVGLGDYNYYKDSDVHKAYTCYFAVYWGKQEDDPIFFNGSRWLKEYPWAVDGQNNFTVNGTTTQLQFYVLSSPSNNLYDTWKTLQNKVKERVKKN